MNDRHGRSGNDDAERRSRIRRTTIVLALVAAAFYLGFIVFSIVRGTQG